MHNPTLVAHPRDEQYEVIQALNMAEATPLISLGTVEEAMKFLKKRYHIE